MKAGRGAMHECQGFHQELERNVVRGPGRVEEAFTEKAVFLPSFEKKKHVHEADKGITGRRAQQNQTR